MKAKNLKVPICFLSGMALGCCLLVTKFGLLVFFLAVPALAVLKKEQTCKDLFVCSSVFSVGLYAVAYLPAFSVKPNVSQSLIFWVDLAVYVAIVLVHGTIMTGAILLGHRLPAPKGCRAFYVSVFWTLAEWLFGFGVLAWPTARVSLALWEYPMLFRSASIGGQLFVSFIIVLVNALLSEAVLSVKKKERWLLIAVAISVLCGNIMYGAFSSESVSGDLEIAVVQPGGSTVGGNNSTVYDDAFELVNQAAQHSPKLILLPESIFTRYHFFNETVQDCWKGFAMRSDADMIVGGELNGVSTVFQYSDSGERIGFYQKTREVPFFEKDMTVPVTASSTEYSSVLETNVGNLGVMICYESMFSDLACAAVKNGANVLFVPTNDSWFDAVVAQKLHSAHAAYRAVETGRTLIQASVNGMTVVFDKTGQITDLLPHGVKDVLYTEISTETQDTVYCCIGDMWLLIGMFAVLSAAVYKKIKNEVFL